MELTAIFLGILAIVQVATAVRHVVYWDRKLIPKLANGGLAITLEVDDWMDVLCPYAVNQDEHYPRSPKSVYLQLYNVTRDEYLDCDTENGIKLQSCDNPGIEKKLTTKFQERSPYPFGFTFIPGATYYYISKPLHNPSGGCTDDTLKMRVHVKKKGTVFSRRDHERTRTYHLTHEETPIEKGRSTMVEGLTPEQHKEKPRRHHHHESAAPKMTRPPRVVIQYETRSEDAEKARANAARQDGSGNGVLRVRRHWLSAILLALIPSVLLRLLSCNCGIWQ